MKRLLVSEGRSSQDCALRVGLQNGLFVLLGIKSGVDDVSRAFL